MHTHTREWCASEASVNAPPSGFFHTVPPTYEKLSFSGLAQPGKESIKFDKSDNITEAEQE